LIIIGGGVSFNHEKFFPYLDLQAQLLPAQFKNQAGIVGAACFAANQIAL
jgi:polyphosphate glucokinase